MNVNDIRELFRKAVPDEDGMLVLKSVSFEADKTKIFGTVDREYIANELAWYYSKSRYVFRLKDTPQIWKDISSNHGKINSNYGWCIFSGENGNQYENALKALLANTNSRQAIMIYNRPGMHLDAIDDDMYDFICTNAVIYDVENEKLNATVQMRSNDAIYGYKNDWAWQKHVLDRLAKDLLLTPGVITWQVANLHIYPRHKELVR